MVVVVIGAGWEADDISVVLVLAGCEQPASNADPANSTMPSVIRRDDFVAVILQLQKERLVNGRTIRIGRPGWVLTP